MTVAASVIMKRASTILQDADAVRWTPIELHDWLNEAQRAVAIAKPNAKSGTVTIPLIAGTKQELPAQYTILSRIVRNGGANGRAVRQLARREILDAQVPGWHSTTVLPFSAEVQYVFQDMLNPREFYVAPGNTGTGSVEAIVGMVPANIAAPAAGQQLNIDAYTGTIDLPAIYQSILLDFLLFRAFSKDSAAPDAAQRAQVHLGLATNALGAMGASEMAMGMATAFLTQPPAAAG